MLRKGHILVISVISISLLTILSIEAQKDFEIPSWVKQNALWWGQGTISDSDFISALNYMIEKNIVRVSNTENDEWKMGYEKLETENKKLENDVSKLTNENQRLQDAADQHYDWYTKEFKRNQDLVVEYNKIYNAYLYYYELSTGSSAGNSQYQQSPSTKSTPKPTQETSSSKDCSGSARCISGIVTEIIDGDTLKVDGESIRFTLTSTPELNEFGGQEAKEFIEKICPVGSKALVDEDDGQTQGSYGRIIGVIYCNGMNLNEEILDADLGYLSSGFCSKSEFSTHAWAKKHGC